MARLRGRGLVDLFSGHWGVFAMRMVPPRPPESATGSERRVFTALQSFRASDDSLALSSLNLSRHEYQRWGEIDFVVIQNSGLLVVEVKGGIATCAEGLWRFQDRWGRTVERASSPIAQAQAAFSSLLKLHLEPGVGRGLLEKATLGFCSIFPAMSNRQVRSISGGPEMPMELVGSADDLCNVAALGAFLKRALGFFRPRGGRERPGWNRDEVRKVGQCLRPAFDRVPPLSLLVAQLRDEQFALTEGQYRFLDFIEAAPRVICTGGAGCGKTFLAVECLRREASNNPVLITGTETLAKHLRASNVPDPRRILSFDEADSALGQFSATFDTLIVDEGQQVTNRESLLVLDRLLTGGISAGRWRWFADPNHQVLHSSRFDPKVQAELERLAVPTRLRENCRNTPQIVANVESLTGADLGDTGVKGSGPEVEFAQGDSAEELVRSTAALLRKWLADPEVQPGHVVMLSPRPPDQSSIPEVVSIAGKSCRPWHAGWDTAPHYPRYIGAATMDEFRGLESPLVVLCDLDDSLPDLERYLYVGMTRANYGLIVTVDKEARLRLMRSHLGRPATA